MPIRIYNGKFQDAVSGTLLITGGTFGGAVNGSATSTISGSPVFNSSVTTVKDISGGTFNGAVTGVTGTISGSPEFISSVECAAISGGTFKGDVDTTGNITGGIFGSADAQNDENNGLTVTAGGSISNGTFHVAVDGAENISGGTFNAAVSGVTGTISGSPEFADSVTTSGAISGGTFNAAVSGATTISGGTFKGAVTATGTTISGGTFETDSSVTGATTISGGTFAGGVVSAAEITAGTFNGDVTKSTLKGGKYTKVDPTADTTSENKNTLDGNTYKVIYTNSAWNVVSKDAPYIYNVKPDGDTSLETEDFTAFADAVERANTMAEEEDVESVTITVTGDVLTNVGTAALDETVVLLLSETQLQALNAGTLTINKGASLVKDVAEPGPDVVLVGAGGTVINTTGATSGSVAIKYGASQEVTIAGDATVAGALAANALGGTGGNTLANVTISSGEVTLSAAVTATKVTVSGGTLNITDGGGITGAVENSGTLNLSGSGAITGDVTNGESATLSITGGTITGAVDNSGTMTVDNGVITGAVDNKVEGASLTIQNSGTSGENVPGFQAAVTKTAGTVAISGGKFAAAPAQALLAPNYGLTAINENPYYYQVVSTVGEGAPVATVRTGDTAADAREAGVLNFTTLNAAITYANSASGTVKLLTVKNVGDSIAYTTNSTFDSDIIVEFEADAAAKLTDGTLKFAEGATLIDEGTDSSKALLGAEGSYLVWNEATNGGTIDVTKSASGFAWTINANAVATSTALEINNTSFTVAGTLTVDSLVIDDDGTLTINGTGAAVAAKALENKGTVNVTQGTLTLAKGDTSGEFKNLAGGKINVTATNGVLALTAAGDVLQNAGTVTFKGAGASGSADMNGSNGKIDLQYGGTVVLETLTADNGFATYLAHNNAGANDSDSAPFTFSPQLAAAALKVTKGEPNGETTAQSVEINVYGTGDVSYAISYDDNLTDDGLTSIVSTAGGTVASATARPATATVNVTTAAGTPANGGPLYVYVWTDDPESPTKLVIGKPAAPVSTYYTPVAATRDANDDGSITFTGDCQTAALEYSADGGTTWKAVVKNNSENELTGLTPGVYKLRFAGVEGAAAAAAENSDGKLASEASENIIVKAYVSKLELSIAAAGLTAENYKGYLNGVVIPDLSDSFTATVAAKKANGDTISFTNATPTAPTVSAMSIGTITGGNYTATSHPGTDTFGDLAEGTVYGMQFTIGASDYYVFANTLNVTVNGSAVAAFHFTDADATKSGDTVLMTFEQKLEGSERITAVSLALNAVPVANKATPKNLKGEYTHVGADEGTEHGTLAVTLTTAAADPGEALTATTATWSKSTDSAFGNSSTANAYSAENYHRFTLTLTPAAGYAFDPTAVTTVTFAGDAKDAMKIVGNPSITESGITLTVQVNTLDPDYSDLMPAGNIEIPGGIVGEASTSEKPVWEYLTLNDVAMTEEDYANYDFNTIALATNMGAAGSIDASGKLSWTLPATGEASESKLGTITVKDLNNNTLGTLDIVLDGDVKPKITTLTLSAKAPLIGEALDTTVAFTNGVLATADKAGSSALDGAEISSVAWVNAATDPGTASQYEAVTGDAAADATYGLRLTVSAGSNGLFDASTLSTVKIGEKSMTIAEKEVAADGSSVTLVLKDTSISTMAALTGTITLRKSTGAELDSTVKALLRDSEIPKATVTLTLYKDVFGNEVSGATPISLTQSGTSVDQFSTADGALTAGATYKVSGTIADTRLTALYEFDTDANGEAASDTSGSGAGTYARSVNLKAKPFVVTIANVPTTATAAETTEAGWTAGTSGTFTASYDIDNTLALPASLTVGANEAFAGWRRSDSKPDAPTTSLTAKVVVAVQNADSGLENLGDVTYNAVVNSTNKTVIITAKTGDQNIPLASNGDTPMVYTGTLSGTEAAITVTIPSTASAKYVIGTPGEYVELDTTVSGNTKSGEISLSSAANNLTETVYLKVWAQSESEPATATHTVTLTATSGTTHAITYKVTKDGETRDPLATEIANSVLTGKASYTEGSDPTGVTIQNVEGYEKEVTVTSPATWAADSDGTITLNSATSDLVVTVTYKSTNAGLDTAASNLGTAALHLENGTGVGNDGAAPASAIEYTLGYLGGDGSKTLTLVSAETVEANKGDVKIYYAVNNGGTPSADGIDELFSGTPDINVSGTKTLWVKVVPQSGETGAKYYKITPVPMILITYNAGNGTGNESIDYAESGQNYTIKSTSDRSFTKANYSFSKWSDGTNEYEETGTISAPTSNLTLTAQWTLADSSLELTAVGSNGQAITISGLPGSGTNVALTANATKDQDTITLTPTSANAKSITVGLQGQDAAAVASGDAADPINLTRAGNTVIEIVVTAVDNSTTTYTLTVTRAGDTTATVSSVTISAEASEDKTAFNLPATATNAPDGTLANAKENPFTATLPVSGNRENSTIKMVIDSAYVKAVKYLLKDGEAQTTNDIQGGTEAVLSKNTDTNKTTATVSGVNLSKGPTYLIGVQAEDESWAYYAIKASATAIASDNTGLTVTSVEKAYIEEGHELSEYGFTIPVTHGLSGDVVLQLADAQANVKVSKTLDNSSPEEWKDVEAEAKNVTGAVTLASVDYTAPLYILVIAENEDAQLYTLEVTAPQVQVTYQAGTDPAQDNVVTWQTVTDGKVTLADNTFTANANMAFMGWKATGDGSSTAAGAQYSVTGDVTLVAQWASTLNSIMGVSINDVAQTLNEVVNETAHTITVTTNETTAKLALTVPADATVKLGSDPQTNDAGTVTLTAVSDGNTITVTSASGAENTYTVTFVSANITVEATSTGLVEDTDYTVSGHKITVAATHIPLTVYYDNSGSYVRATCVRSGDNYEFTVGNDVNKVYIGILGDVNGQNGVDVADITQVAGIVADQTAHNMSAEVKAQLAKGYELLADLNNSGAPDVADITLTAGAVNKTSNNGVLWPVTAQ